MDFSTINVKKKMSMCYGNTLLRRSQRRADSFLNSYYVNDCVLKLFLKHTKKNIQS